MMIVKTSLKPSLIAGIGLFADEFIPSGTVVWKFIPPFDLIVTDEQIELLPPPSRDRIKELVYPHRFKGLSVLCGDDARFFNHSETPNTIDSYVEEEMESTIANKDINIGEEITCYYKTFWEGYVPII